MSSLTNLLKQQQLPSGITNYNFPEKLLIDQGHNFESQLIKELCKLAYIQKVPTVLIIQKLMANAKINQTLIRMIGTLGDQRQATLQRLSSHTSACIQLYQE